MYTTRRIFWSNLGHDRTTITTNKRKMLQYTTVSNMIFLPSFYESKHILRGGRAARGQAYADCVGQEAERDARGQAG